MRLSLVHVNVLLVEHFATMSTRPVESPMDDKHVDLQIGSAANSRPADYLEEATADHDELVKSRYDKLSVFQALWKFRLATFYTFLVFTGYTIDGFEVRGNFRWPPEHLARY